MEHAIGENFGIRYPFSGILKCLCNLEMTFGNLHAADSAGYRLQFVAMAHAIDLLDD